MSFFFFSSFVLNIFHTLVFYNLMIHFFHTEIIVINYLKKRVFINLLLNKHINNNYKYLRILMQEQE